MPKQFSSRRFTVVPGDIPPDGIADMGPAASEARVGTYIVQFVPSGDFVGEFKVLGKLFGEAARAADASFAPIPYRRININGLASDYAIVSDVINGASIIQVPCNGMALGLLMTCSAGSCDVVSWDLSGPSSI